MLFICYPACSTCKKAQLFLDALGKPYEVRNIKQYLLTTINNAPITIDNYYASLVNHDMYGEGRCGK